MGRAIKRSYAQFGEDKLIADVFERIGTKNRVCFEVGAHDGRYFSNTLAFREQGWHAILAECHPDHYAALEAEFGEQSDCWFGKVECLDTLLDAFSAPTDIDLGVIDVDGRDYWLWHDMVKFRPRVLLIEFSPYVTQPWHDPVNPVPREDRSVPVKQTARQPTIDLATEKGYELVGETFCNLLFAGNEVIK